MTENQELNKKLESTEKALGTVIHLLDKVNIAVETGFASVNKRLSELEGTDGMQGVNASLGDIKVELQKIQKAYPYQDYVNNLDAIKGKA